MGLQIGGMGEYTGELTYSKRECRRCLFNEIALPIRGRPIRKFLPPCLICDFVHEDLIKWEPVHRLNPEYRMKGSPCPKYDTRGNDKRFAGRLAMGHALLKGDDYESRGELEEEKSGMTSNWSEQMGNREESKDYYDPNV